jgi:putative endonuclease
LGFSGVIYLSKFGFHDDMADQNKVGKKGEELAARFLARKGFNVVARNFRYRKAEIDIIVQRDDWLIFVEVKTRSSAAFGEPEAFVGSKKVRLIFLAAEEYIYAIDWNGHVRFDVISVKLGKDIEIVHFEDAIN